MAVAGVSPGDPDTVRTVPEGGKDELGAYSGRARNTDNPEVGGVLETAYTCQVRRTVTAPVAEKTCDLGLPVVHLFILYGCCVIIKEFFLYKMCYFDVKGHFRFSVDKSTIFIFRDRQVE